MFSLLFFHPHASKKIFLTFFQWFFSFISSERLTKLIYNEFLVSPYVAINPTPLTSLPSCLCRFLRLLDLHCGSWGIVPMARPSQIYGILVPARVVHRRRVSFHHHNEAKSWDQILIFNSRLFQIKSHLNISRKWEVSALWMSFEAVIGENAAQVGVVGEEHTIHVPNLALVPVGGFVDLVARVNRRQLVGVSFDADSRVVAEREKVVNDFEAVWTRWHIHS